MLFVLFICAPWELALTEGNTRVERRLTGSGLHEFRVSTSTIAAPAVVADAFWQRQAVRGVGKYVLLKRTATEKLAYIQLNLPVIKNRDYTVHMQRYDDPEHGLYQIDSTCDSAAGPEPDSEFVRVTFCEGKLTIERDEDGRTLITNVSVADPAGAIPHWMVNMLAPKAAAHFVDDLIAESLKR